MTEDWYVAALDRVHNAADELRSALDRMEAPLRAARAARLEGVGLPEILDLLLQRGGKDARLSPTRAAEQLEQAVTAYRAAVIRALVDNDGLSMSELGHRTGVSRQMISRLYHAAN
jgi:hypothetical protein